MPLNRTVNIIINRVYKEKLIKTNLSKRTLKKLILDTCQKTAFVFNNTIYEQKDGVSMGASLGPVLANIIMTECEKVVVNELCNNGIIKFYMRYVDDTLLLVKRQHIETILEAFNKFDPNLVFTVDKFENTVPHFLDLEISPNGLTIFRKDTHTGQYTNISSFSPWKWKTAWIRSLVTRAKKICSKEQLHNEIKKIKVFASWNAYPRKIVNGIIKHVLLKSNCTVANETDDSELVFFHVNYAGSVGEQLIKKCAKKLLRCTNKKVKFITRYSVTKVSFFTSMKDRLHQLSKSCVVYQFVCPGCNKSYIGKTERTLHERTQEHSSRDDSAIKQHMDYCMGCEHIFSIHNMFHDDANRNVFRTNIVRQNTKIIDSSRNWNILLFKEAYFIKEKRPSLNNGVKASKELQLF